MKFRVRIKFVNIITLSSQVCDQCSIGLPIEVVTDVVYSRVNNNISVRSYILRTWYVLNLGSPYTFTRQPSSKSTSSITKFDVLRVLFSNNNRTVFIKWSDMPKSKAVSDSGPLS